MVQESRGEFEVVKGSSISVLVVDDSEQWRNVVRASLSKNLRLHVMEEAADGLEAVQKASSQLPDLVTLDIGLPKLNGIKVAQEIKRVSPRSRVVFLTENHSCDIVDAAFENGAKSYIVKSEFAREFIPAIESVLEGKLFLSARLPALVIALQTM